VGGKEHNQVWFSWPEVEAMLKYKDKQIEVFKRSVADLSGRVSDSMWEYDTRCREHVGNPTGWK
jgi:hypothetical protein